MTTRILPLTMLTLAFSASTATAQSRTNPLAGITQVTMKVSFAAVGRPPVGVSESRLQAILESRLQRSGLRVLSEAQERDEALATDMRRMEEGKPLLFQNTPYVLLRVSTVDASNVGGTVNGYAYTVNVAARVFTGVPFNTAAVAPQELWSEGIIGIASAQTPSTEIERAIGEKVDAFLTAWNRANPRR